MSSPDFTGAAQSDVTDVAQPRRWSIRRRLVGWLSFTIAAVLAVLFVSMDHWIDDGVYGHLDSVLADEARTLAAGLAQYDLLTLEQLLPQFNVPGHTDFFAVYDAAGAVQMKSRNSLGKALVGPPSGVSLPHYYDVRTPDTHFGRALAVPFDDDQMLVVATERAGWDASERRIHYTLLAGIAVATAVVVLLVLTIITRAFAPLLKQGAHIAKLDADSPPQKLADDLPVELAPFAAAFDTGIGRLYDAIERERRFSRDIAHELRTPLAEIRATAEVALRDGDEEELREGLRTAIESTERMQRSVNTLLALARYESGQESPALDPLDLAALVAAQAQSLQRLAQQRQIRFMVNASQPAWVHSDVGIIERILTNLMHNALDYSPAGERVSCSLRHSQNDYLVIIENAAPDLTPADMVHFGARFWRKNAEGGTAQHAGLGLALAFGLARALHVGLEFELQQGRLRARLGPFASL